MPRRNNNTKQVRDDLALLISAGENTDDYVEDLRQFNGRDGTQFTKLFDTIAGILSENGQLEDHSRMHTSTSCDEKQGGVTYIPPCVSVQDLHRKACDKCKASGGTDACQLRGV